MCKARAWVARRGGIVFGDEGMTESIEELRRGAWKQAGQLTEMQGGAMAAAAAANKHTADECDTSSHCISMIAETDISSQHECTPNFASLSTVAGDT